MSEKVPEKGGAVVSRPVGRVNQGSASQVKSREEQTKMALASLWQLLEHGGKWVAVTARKVLQNKVSSSGLCFRSICWKTYLGVWPRMGTCTEWNMIQGENRRRYNVLCQTLPRSRDSETAARIIEELQPAFRNLQAFADREVQNVIINVITIWCMTNNAGIYWQGMSHLVIAIFYAVHQDVVLVHHLCSQNSKPYFDTLALSLFGVDHVEADVYIIFFLLMVQLKPLYQDLTNPMFSVQGAGPESMLALCWKMLEANDRDLATHLLSTGVAPQLLGAVLLLGQDWRIPTLVQIWDNILADSDASFRLLPCVCVSIFIRNRDLLLKAKDQVECVDVLRHYVKQTGGSSTTQMLKLAQQLRSDTASYAQPVIQKNPTVADVQPSTKSSVRSTPIATNRVEGGKEAVGATSVAAVEKDSGGENSTARGSDDGREGDQSRSADAAAGHGVEGSSQMLLSVKVDAASAYQQALMRQPFSQTPLDLPNDVPPIWTTTLGYPDDNPSTALRGDSTFTTRVRRHSSSETRAGPADGRRAASGLRPRLHTVGDPGTMSEDDLCRRVPIWHTVEKRKISGNAAPMQQNLHAYLVKHTHCEIYNFQDMQDVAQIPRRSQPTDKRIWIWNRREKRKIVGNAAPMQRNLEVYLAMHKDCEVYTGQDKVGDTNDAISKSSNKGSARTTSAIGSTPCEVGQDSREGHEVEEPDFILLDKAKPTSVGIDGTVSSNSSISNVSSGGEALGLKSALPTAQADLAYQTATFAATTVPLSTIEMSASPVSSMDSLDNSFRTMSTDFSQGSKNDLSYMSEGLTGESFPARD